MKNLFLSLIVLFVFSCKNDKNEVDAIVINANVYTVDANFNRTEAFAIKDGKFVATGSTKDIQQHYSATKVIDAKGQTIVPGLIDAHCHFYNLGLNFQIGRAHV